MINHVALVRYYYPEARFIYVVRDGRDVASSAKKSIFNHYCVYYIAKLWKEEQRIGIYWLNKLSKNDIFLIKYEDLTRDTEGSVKAICSFLNEPYEQDMLNFFETKEARKSSSISAAWKNAASPIMKNSLEKFKTELSKKEIYLFEAIAAPELDYFFYRLTIPFYISEGIRARGSKFRISYLFAEIFLNLRVQIKSFFSDKNNLLRYKKFWFLKFIRIKRVIKCSSK